MKTRTITLFAVLCPLALGGCDLEAEQALDGGEEAPPRVNNDDIDGEPADFDAQDDEFKEEVNASLLEALEESDDDSDIEFRASSCTVDCPGYTTALTCTGSASRSSNSTSRSCTACDWTFDDGVLGVGDIAGDELIGGALAPQGDRGVGLNIAGLLSETAFHIEVGRGLVGSSIAAHAAYWFAWGFRTRNVGWSAADARGRPSALRSD